MKDRLKVMVSSQDEEINEMVINIVKALFNNVKVSKTEKNEPYKQAHLTVEDVHKNMKK